MLSVAPAGNSVVVTVLRVIRSGVDRDTGGIDALLRYQVVLRVDRTLCSIVVPTGFFFALRRSRLLGVALPTTASFASEALLQVQGDSSRQALASLSTRVGRRLSRSKLTEQRLLVVGAGGGGGALTVTVVVADAVWPLSSTTLQVTVMVPGAAPAVVSVAVEVLPLIEPAVAL